MIILQGSKIKVSSPYLGIYIYSSSVWSWPMFPVSHFWQGLIPWHSIPVIIGSPRSGLPGVLHLLFVWQMPTHPSKLSWNVTYSVKIFPSNPDRILLSICWQHTHRDSYPYLIALTSHTHTLSPATSTIMVRSMPSILRHPDPRRLCWQCLGWWGGSLSSRPIHFCFQQLSWC